MARDTTSSFELINYSSCISGILCLFTLNFWGQMVFFSRWKTLSLHLVFLGWMTLSYIPNSVWLHSAVNLGHRQTRRPLPWWSHHGALYLTRRSHLDSQPISSKEGGACRRGRGGWLVQFGPGGASTGGWPKLSRHGRNLTLPSTT